MKTAKELARSNVWDLRPYRPGKPIEEVQRELGIDDVLKLASNENPIGPSPKVIEAIQNAITDVRLYPDASCYYLKEALAGFHGVPADRLTLANGTDEIITYIGLAFLEPGDNVVTSEKTFMRYESAAVTNGAEFVEVPMTVDYRYDLRKIREAVNDRTKLIFIANPNNPTGTIVTQPEVKAFMHDLPDSCVVVFDEAYIEYVRSNDFPESCAYVDEGRSVFVLHTFSKAYGLAGLRIGYAIAKPDFIDAIERVRCVFNVTRLSQAAAVAAVGDQDHVNRVVAVNTAGAGQLEQGFGQMGLEYIPTHANFIMVDFGRDGKGVFESLLREGIIIRPGDIFAMPTWGRITIGTPEQNGRLLTSLAKVLDK
jgi:histidinol-phosphate aminotransferase